MKKKLTRATSFTIAISLIFTALVGRLFYIQLVKGDYYQSLAEEKGEKEIIEPAPRGDIYDKNGKKIATSTQGFNIIYSNYEKKAKEKAEEANKRINNALIETIRIISKTDIDKLNLSALPIVLEGDKYVYNFTATSDELRAKQESNFKKEYGIAKTEEKLTKDQGKTVSFNIDEVVSELEKKYGIVDSESGEKNYNLTKLENLQLIALRGAISSISYSQYKTVYIAKDVQKNTALSIMSKSSELSGISYEVSPIRTYPDGDLGASFLGYLGKIDEDSAEKYKSLGYDINRELVGKLGLEKSLENNSDLGINLRGEPGVKYVNVDKYGQVTKETAVLDPIPGDSIKTSIDMDLQKVARESLVKTMADIRSSSNGGNATRGSVIVTNIKTNEILALVNAPTYDPNLFAKTGALSDPEMYKKYFVPEKNQGDRYDKIPAPMFNYATQGAIPPGSILKPFVGVAGLQEGVVTPEGVINCTGHYERMQNSKEYNCWVVKKNPSGHGPLNVSQALEVSCNIYFFEVGRLLGEEKFAEWATKFGLSSNPKTGEKPTSGIEIEESPGGVGTDPKYKATAISIYLSDVTSKISDIDYGGYTITKGTEEYKKIEEMFTKGEYSKSTLESIGITNKKAQSYISQRLSDSKSEIGGLGQLLNVSIGQGSTLLTPLQMIGALNTLLNDGKRYSTHLVKEVLNSDGTVKREIKPELLEEFTINPEYKKAILNGMESVTSGEHGTAASTFKNFDIKTGGKTGSASVSKVQRENGRKAYGWFLGFAPFDNPEISVVVVIYDAESGSYTAPVAKAVYEQYFKKDKEKEEQNTEAQNQNNQVQNGTADVNTTGN